jgi:hypothetical protein
MDSAPTQGLRKTDALSIGRSTKAAANWGDPFLRTIAIQSVPGKWSSVFDPAAIRFSKESRLNHTTSPARSI